MCGASRCFYRWRELPGGLQVAAPGGQADARSAFNTLFLGLGAVALLVGAIGVANIVIIAVLERRSEIGLRRTLGPLARGADHPDPRPMTRGACTAYRPHSTAVPERQLLGCL